MLFIVFFFFLRLLSFEEFLKIYYVHILICRLKQISCQKGNLQAIIVKCVCMGGVERLHKEVNVVELLYLSHMRRRSLPAAVLCVSSISLLSESIVLHNTV